MLLGWDHNTLSMCHNNLYQQLTSEQQQAMSNDIALLGYIYISKPCRETAVGLWSKRVGAEDPAPSVHTFQSFRITLAALLVHVFQLSTVQREAWSCPPRPHLSTVGTEAQ